VESGELEMREWGRENEGWMTEDGRQHTYHSLRLVGTARREPEFAEMLLRRRGYGVEAGLGGLRGLAAGHRQVGDHASHHFMCMGGGGGGMVWDICDMGIDEVGGVRRLSQLRTVLNRRKLGVPLSISVMRGFALAYSTAALTNPAPQLPSTPT
jgi:hypothetical protein